ncbi:uncharacterized protein LOC105663633 isoform X2 [Megachile rotundata]|uniref:uncharacterized protein LOC105663633 isoform X2 n=1 Tax=Megachile rotundata TaxID=143995 RepID=UPI003FD0E73B
MSKWYGSSATRDTFSIQGSTRVTRGVANRESMELSVGLEDQKLNLDPVQKVQRKRRG